MYFITRKIVRWLSLVPVLFTILILSDWILRLTLWFIILPMNLFGIKLGVIGKSMNIVSNYVFNMNSNDALVMSITFLILGYTLMYIFSLIIPISNKKVAKFLKVLYIIILIIISSLLLVTTVFGNISVIECIRFLIEISLVVLGVVIARQKIATETKEEVLRYEGWIQSKIIFIFVFAIIFTITVGCFLYAL